MPAPRAVCRRCGTLLPETETPDANGWCPACRAQAVRRSTRLALVPTVLLAVLVLWLLMRMGLVESRFMIVWLALAAVATWLAFKVARRVVFEILLSRTRAPGRPT